MTTRISYEITFDYETLEVEVYDKRQDAWDAVIGFTEDVVLQDTVDVFKSGGLDLDEFLDMANGLRRTLEVMRDERDKGRSLSGEWDFLGVGSIVVNQLVEEVEELTNVEVDGAVVMTTTKGVIEW